MENLGNNELKLKYLKVINKMIELMIIHVSHQAAKPATTHKAMSSDIAAIKTPIEEAYKAALQAKNIAKSAVKDADNAMKKLELAQRNRVRVGLQIGDSLPNYLNSPEYERAGAKGEEAIKAFTIANEKAIKALTNSASKFHDLVVVTKLGKDVVIKIAENKIEYVRQVSTKAAEAKKTLHAFRGIGNERKQLETAVNRADEVEITAKKDLEALLNHVANFSQIIANSEEAAETVRDQLESMQK